MHSYIKKNAPMKYPNIPPKTENIVAIRKTLKKSFFLEITIGIIIISGGMGKNELSIKDTTAK